MGQQEQFEILVESVAKMRELQKAYFQARRQHSINSDLILREARIAEKKVDELLLAIYNAKKSGPSLFD